MCPCGYRHIEFLATRQGDHLADAAFSLCLTDGQRGIQTAVVRSLLLTGRLSAWRLYGLLKCTGKCGNRRETIFGFLRQGAQEHRVKGGGQTRIEGAGLGGLSRE